MGGVEQELLDVELLPFVVLVVDDAVEGRSRISWLLSVRCLAEFGRE
jgi:hypothetical protein